MIHCRSKERHICAAVGGCRCTNSSALRGDCVLRGGQRDPVGGGALRGTFSTRDRGARRPKRTLWVVHGHNLWPQFNEETTRERKTESENGAGEGEKERHVRLMFSHFFFFSLSFLFSFFLFSFSLSLFFFCSLFFVLCSFFS